MAQSLISALTVLSDDADFCSSRSQASSCQFHRDPRSSGLIVPLLSAARLPVNTHEPVPLEAKHAHVITLPRTC